MVWLVEGAIFDLVVRLDDGGVDVWIAGEDRGLSEELNNLNLSSRLGLLGNEGQRWFRLQ